MSEKSLQKNIIKNLILKLHQGERVENLKQEFLTQLKDVDSAEIASIEQELIENGELTADQVTKLCNLHVAIFKESLEEKLKPESLPGHPLHSYMEENKKALELVNQLEHGINPQIMLQLTQIDVHYTRLENQLFPILEKVGFSGPSQVMWAKHDEVRKIINERNPAKLQDLLNEIKELIFKEENILFPTALKKLSEEQWLEVRNGEEEIGFAWITPGNIWNPITPEFIHEKKTNIEYSKENHHNNLLGMNTGKLSLEQLNLILTNLPVEISFIDNQDEVKYYSNHKHRIFPRSPAVIGRNVKNCHPPKSQHIVQKILSAFKSGEKSIAEFWITLNAQFLYIRYFAIRNEENQYIGTLEVTQDITEIQKLTGMKRLLDWN